MDGGISLGSGLQGDVQIRRFSVQRRPARCPVAAMLEWRSERWMYVRLRTWRHGHEQKGFRRLVGVGIKVDFHNWRRAASTSNRRVKRRSSRQRVAEQHDKRKFIKTRRAVTHISKPSEHADRSKYDDSEGRERKEGLRS